jgi:hypothetical protein
VQGLQEMAAARGCIGGSDSEVDGKRSSLRVAIAMGLIAYCLPRGWWGGRGRMGRQRRRR